jgi:hypothetical protein
MIDPSGVTVRDSARSYRHRCILTRGEMRCKALESRRALMKLTENKKKFDFCLCFINIVELWVAIIGLSCWKKRIWRS